MAPLQVALLFLGLVVLPAALATDGTTFSMSENGYNVDWMAGHATWYGDPYGEGSSGKHTYPHFSEFCVPSKS